MSNTLSWVANPLFYDKRLRAPYHVEKDNEYYNDLCGKFEILLNAARESDADKESIDIIISYSESIKRSIKKYYEGRLSDSYVIVKDLLREILDDSFAVNCINSSKAFPGYGEEIQFFRGRICETFMNYSAKEMLHIPFDNREKTGTTRFSIPGLPSLYLANTSYACWLELGCVPDHMLNVSPVLLEGNQRVLNLAVSMRDQIYLNDWDEDRVHCWIKLLMLMIATSYIVDEKDRFFKSEYIISQSIMLGCKELDLDGVAYYSNRVEDYAFAQAAVNLALFTKYEDGKKFSEICKHVKIGDSFNYSMYKQLSVGMRNIEYPVYHLKRTGRATNIGNFSRQFSYFDTEFCAFDQFLFSGWENKDNICYGNALV